MLHYMLTIIMLYHKHIQTKRVRRYKNKIVQCIHINNTSQYTGKIITALLRARKKNLEVFLLRKSIVISKNKNLPNVPSLHISQDNFTRHREKNG